MTDETDDQTIDGFTLEELGDYLDHGRRPRNPLIERSAQAQSVLDALQRLRTTSLRTLQEEARGQEVRDDVWIRDLMSVVQREAQSGRSIPLRSDDPRARLTLTEGAVRGLIREVGDGVGGAMIGSCKLVGDVTMPGEAIRIDITASVAYGPNLRSTANAVRDVVRTMLLGHTELNVVAIDVTIEDVHARYRADDGRDGSTEPHSPDTEGAQ